MTITAPITSARTPVDDTGAHQALSAMEREHAADGDGARESRDAQLRLLPMSTPDLLM